MRRRVLEWARARAALGDDAGEHAQRCLGDYSAFADAGCDEPILMPCDPDVAQVSPIAGAAGL